MVLIELNFYYSMPKLAGLGTLSRSERLNFWKPSETSVPVNLNLYLFLLLSRNTILIKILSLITIQGGITVATFSFLRVSIETFRTYFLDLSWIWDSAHDFSYAIFPCYFFQMPMIASQIRVKTLEPAVT